MSQKFNPAPGWPSPPSADWTPGPDWAPDPSWPPAPDGWQVLVDDGAVGEAGNRRVDGALGRPNKEGAADTSHGSVGKPLVDSALGSPSAGVADLTPGPAVASSPGVVSPMPSYGVPAYMPPQRPAVIIVGTPKSVGLAAALGFFFGPLGMLYSTVLGAAVMFGVNLLVAFVTFGFGLLLTWPMCAVWAAVAANQHNQRMASAGARAF